MNSAFENYVVKHMLTIPQDKHAPVRARVPAKATHRRVLKLLAAERVRANMFSNDRLVLKSGYEVTERQRMTLIEDNTALTDTVADLKATISTKDLALDGQAHKLTDLNSKLTERQRHVANLDAALSARASTIETQAKDLAEYRKTINAMAAARLRERDEYETGYQAAHSMARVKVLACALIGLIAGTALTVAVYAINGTLC